MMTIADTKQQAGINCERRLASRESRAKAEPMPGTHKRPAGGLTAKFERIGGPC